MRYENITKEQVVELIFKCFPYSEQIEKLDFSSDDLTVSFYYRGIAFYIEIAFLNVAVHGDINTDILKLITTEFLKREYNRTYLLKD